MRSHRCPCAERHLSAQAPLCASLGPASAFRYAGFAEQAVLLEAHAEEILAARTNQVAAAVDVIRRAGGWKLLHVRHHNPVEDISEHVTIVQLCDSDEENTHVIATCGMCMAL